jgi:ubiquitin-conjugating enzyme E2 J2
MATDICVRRLTKELKALRKEPPGEPKITVAPNESNILEMHYVIEVGSAASVGENPYAGGIYHGKLLFPKEYPLKPPGVMICTPNGRFQPGRRLCLSMSDFHPESWNPMWSVSTILTGLYSFMLESNATLGSIETTTSQKRHMATVSLEYNCRDKQFCKLFPEYVERHEREKQEQKTAVVAVRTPAVSKPQDARAFPFATSLVGIVAGLLIMWSFNLFLN